jgi:FkbM family methyltransferase
MKAISALRETLANFLFDIVSKWIFGRGGRRSFTFTLKEIRHAQLSFSQCSEDLILMKILDEKMIERGFYVDVGAFNPIIYSNTCLLHHLGFVGVNIDMDADKISEFEIMRPQDHNICAAISSHEGHVRRFKYAESATNRIGSLETDTELSALGRSPIGVDTVECKSLTNVLKHIDLDPNDFVFLNIDCEGHDFEVLRSLDFSIYKPVAICIESLEHAMTRKISDHLSLLGYKTVAFTGVSSLYLRQQ